MTLVVDASHAALWAAYVEHFSDGGRVTRLHTPSVLVDDAGGGELRLVVEFESGHASIMM